MRAFASAFACVVIGAGAATGQVPPTALPTQLTVEEAIAYARRNNPQYQAQSNDVDVASAQVRQRVGAFLPSVSAGMNVGASYSRALTGQGDFGQVEERPEAITSKSSSLSQSVNLNMTVFDGGAMLANLGAARANEEAVEARIGNDLNTLVANVQRRYFAAVRANRQIVVARQQLTLAEERLDIVQRQFEIAAARQSDVLGARSDVARQRQAILDAEAQARTARLQLLMEMGVGGEPDFTLATDFPAALDPAALDAEALVARAVVSSPAVLQAQAASRAADKQATAARGGRWPSLSLSGGFNRGTSQPGGYFGAWDQFNPGNRGATFGMSLSWPIFSRFQTSANIASAEAGADDARYQARQAQVQTETQVRSALIELERTWQALLLADEEAQLSQQRLELAQEEYQAGVTSFTALQQIIQQNEQAQRAAVDARLNHVNARVDLEQQLGGPVQAGG